MCMNQCTSLLHLLMGTATYTTVPDCRSHVQCCVCHYLLCCYLYWRGPSSESSGISSMDACSNELLQQEDLCSRQRSSPSLSPGRLPIASALPFSRHLSPCNYQLAFFNKRGLCGNSSMNNASH